MHHFKIVFILAALIATGITSNAQQQRCHSTELFEIMKTTYPDLESRVRDAETRMRQRLESGEMMRDGEEIIYIPVVVHVIWNTNIQNISDEQIQSQIDVLNEDYNRENVDAVSTPADFLDVAASANIRFCLADMDPNGNITNGITRTQVLTTSFDPFDEDIHYSTSGGKDPWPVDEYLNIWVVNFSNSNILGYSSVPGWWPPQSDGPVINYRFFGREGTVLFPFNKGRTVTHEVGHWLGLRHIWGDGGCGMDDGIDDTPRSDAANFGCATGHISCGTVDMVQNYMDYSDDACFNLFTQGQVDAMRAVLETTRPNLKVSAGCYFNTGINEQDEDISGDISVYPNPANDKAYVQYNSTIDDDIRLELTNSVGQVLSVETGIRSSQVSEINLEGLPAGMYFVRLTGKGKVGVRKLFHNN